MKYSTIIKADFENKSNNQLVSNPDVPTAAQIPIVIGS